MTQTQEPPILRTTPARCRALPIAPVLIRIPAVSVAVGSRSSARPPRRRRLRREVRVVGYLLLATLPISLAFASLGGDRRPSPIATAPPAEAGSFAPKIPAISISISLEPAIAATQASDFAAPPVFLSSQLLPADASPEETSHGGH